MKVKPIGINWNLRYRLEKGRNEILQMKIEIQFIMSLRELQKNALYL